MKLLSAPRQPFVGLAADGGLGIILADFFPLSSSALVATAIIIMLCAVALLRWPSLAATYAVVGAGFFLLHGLRTSNTEGQRLAAELGNRPRVLTATGFVHQRAEDCAQRIRDVPAKARVNRTRRQKTTDTRGLAGSLAQCSRIRR